MTPMGPPAPDSPGVGGGFPSPPAQQNPKADLLLTEVRNIVTAARRIAMAFPQAAEEVRMINNIVSRLAQKAQQSGPGSESQAPPV